MGDGSVKATIEDYKRAIEQHPDKASPYADLGWYHYQNGDFVKCIEYSEKALDLEPGVFTWPDPRDIALSLKRSAERSARRRSDPFRSAMSMLTFYLNRAGNKIDPAQRERLEAAKDELRILYDRPRRYPKT